MIPEDTCKHRRELGPQKIAECSNSDKQPASNFPMLSYLKINLFLAKDCPKCFPLKLLYKYLHFFDDACPNLHAAGLITWCNHSIYINMHERHHHFLPCVSHALDLCARGEKYTVQFCFRRVCCLLWHHLQYGGRIYMLPFICLFGQLIVNVAGPLSRKF